MGAINIPIIIVTLVNAHIEDKRAVRMKGHIAIWTLEQLNFFFRTVTNFKGITLPEP